MKAIIFTKMSRRWTIISDEMSKVLFSLFVLAGFMAMSPLSLKAANHQEANTERPELFTKEGARALQVTTAPQTTQQQTSTVRNLELEQRLMKFAENDKERAEYKEAINEFYSTGGTYAGSVMLQLAIDGQLLETFLNERTDLLINNDINPSLGREIRDDAEAFYRPIRPQKDKIIDWFENTYSPYILQYFQSGQNQTAQEVSEKLDKLVEQIGLSRYDKDFYDAYELVKPKDDNSIRWASYISLKVEIIDYLVFKKNMNSLRMLEKYNSGGYNVSRRSSFERLMDSFRRKNSEK